MVLYLAELTICSGWEITHPQVNLSTRKAVYMSSTAWPMPDRSTPFKQLGKPATEVMPSMPQQAGKLQYFLQSWMQLPQDPWILDTVRSYHALNRKIPTFTFSKEQSTIDFSRGRGVVKPEISQAISNGSFISKIFCSQITS